MQKKLDSLDDTLLFGPSTSATRRRLAALQSEYVADDRAIEDKDVKLAERTAYPHAMFESPPRYLRSA